MKRVKPPHGRGMLVQMEKGETLNPKGRPTKFVSTLLKEFEKEGIERVTLQQVIGLIETMLNKSHDELVKIGDNSQGSVASRIIARHLVRAQNKEQIAEWLLSRAFGKPKEIVEASVDFEINAEVIDGICAKHFKDGSGS